jgi:sortase A
MKKEVTIREVVARAETVAVFPDLSGEIWLFGQPQQPVLIAQPEAAVLPKQKSSHIFLKRGLHVLSTLMITISIFSAVFFSAPFLALELRSAVHTMTNTFFPQADENTSGRGTETADQSGSQNTNSQQTVDVTPPEDQRFRIKISKINVDSNVLANVDASDKDAYTAALKEGVAHAKGTGLPGEDGENKTIFIFAHSTDGTWNISRYNALFYDLKQLQPGDEVEITFWGKKYLYRVKEQRILDADDTTFLIPQKEKETLILQSCFPPGTTWKRLVVTAELVSSE